MVSFVDEGSGPAVLLLHGWPVTPLHWRHVVPGLLGAGLRVLTVTLPGLGDVSARPRTDTPRVDVDSWAKAALATRVAQLLGNQRVHDVAVVGHDWGGTVGYLMAAGAAGELGVRVRALVIEEEVPPGIEVEIPEPGRSSYPDWHGPFLRVPHLAEELLPGREDSFHRAFLTASAGPAGLEPAALESYLSAYRGPAALAATVGYYRTRAQDTQAVRRRAATTLDVPVLTIGGRHAMGTAVADALGQLAGPVDHLQVEPAGHYPAEQAPDLVLPRLLTHISP